MEEGGKVEEALKELAAQDSKIVRTVQRCPHLCARLHKNLHSYAPLHKQWTLYSASFCCRLGVSAPVLAY